MPARLAVGVLEEGYHYDARQYEKGRMHLQQIIEEDIMGKKAGYVCILLLIISLFACAAQQAPIKVFSEDERIVELYVPGCV